MSDGRWRWGTPLICVLCGALFPISAANSDGDDLRPGRYTDLATLAKAEKRHSDALKARAGELDREISELSAGLRDEGVRQAQRNVEEVRDPAGLAARTGPGLTVTMSDAPEEVRATSTEEPRLLVVHQQDIQAVVNAMWRGGAAAITIQGQRMVSTTGIRCEGNAILLQGVPYSQPFVIAAIGDPASLRATLDADRDVANYRADAENPDRAVGFKLVTQGRIEAPAYDGLTTTPFATPMPPGDGE
ncbi:MAG: DUF881 domain-containing protein [Nocardioides sp.]